MMRPSALNLRSAPSLHEAVSAPVHVNGCFWKAGREQRPDWVAIRNQLCLLSCLTDSLLESVQSALLLLKATMWRCVDSRANGIAMSQVSSAMGFGFRCGFLGLLHMEIVQERLEREYDLDLITTAPTVVYRCRMPKGDEITVDNPTKLPDVYDAILEPYVR